MLFRIDTSDKPRQYGFPETEYINGSEIERFIAEETAKEINRKNRRRLISYSKSLSVCLLKYNKYLDNGLHFLNISSHTCAGYTELCYFMEIKHIAKLTSCNTVFCDLPFEEVELVNFFVDVSDNNIVQDYFQKYLKRGKKQFASPEKDKEVVLMRLLDEKVIDADNLNIVYILYGLSIRYDFLRDNRIFNELTRDISNAFYEGRYSEDELQAIMCLINYMVHQGSYERTLS